LDPTSLRGSISDVDHYGVWPSICK